MAFIATKSQLWLCLVCISIALQSKAAASYTTVNSTIVESAVSIGAVCLDGSPPAYLHAEGFGDGKDNWLVYLMGGDWCPTIEDCKSRKTDHLGSSNSIYWNDSTFEFKGILDNNLTNNPDFYNWQKVVVRYCDGSSFTGDIENVDPTTGLHFRGKRIFDAVMADLLCKGMKDAKQVFLTGGSAGGLAVFIHCDRFYNLFPSTTKVKCLSDAGFFLHSKHPTQAKDLESKFREVVALHNSTGVLPEACKKRMKHNAYLCMFPQYVVKDINTPLLIMISPYDSYQMNHTLSTDFYYAVKSHNICPSQYKILNDFRLQFLDTLHQTDKPSRGLFMSNCFLHTQLTSYWGQLQYGVNNKTDKQIVSDWYFDRRSPVQEVDQNNLVKDCYHRMYIKGA